MDSTEEQYLYDLQLQRAEKLDDTAFEKIAADLKPPKKGKYIIAGILALIGDILDWLVLTLVGEAITFIADLLIDPILIGMGFSMNKATKTKEKASENLNGLIEGVHQKIEGYRNAIQSMQTARNKLAGLKRTGRKMKIGLKLKKPTAVKKRGILGKIFLGIGVDFIPFAELYPARTHSVWSAYKAEKAAYEESQSIIQDFWDVKAIKFAELQDYTEYVINEEKELKEEQELQATEQFNA